MENRKPSHANRRGLPTLLAIGLGLALALAPFRSVWSQDSPETPATKVRSTGAADSITIGRPNPGQILHVQSAPRSTYILDFDPEAAQVELVDSDLSLTFEDGARIVFDGLAELTRDGDPPVFRIAGADIGSDMIVAQATAWSETPVLETAAGAELVFKLEFKFVPFPQVRRARLGQ